MVWYRLNKMRRFSVQSSQERLVYFWLLDTVTVAAHPMSSFTQEAQDRVCSQPLWLSRELYHLWFQLLTSSLAVSHFCNPISFSPQFLLIFYISHITVSTSNAFFCVCECRESIKWRRRERMEKGETKSITLVLGVEAAKGWRDLNSSEYRLSRTSFISPLF